MWLTSGRLGGWTAEPADGWTGLTAIRCPRIWNYSFLKKRNALEPMFRRHRRHRRSYQTRTAGRADKWTAGRMNGWTRALVAAAAVRSYRATPAIIPNTNGWTGGQMDGWTNERLDACICCGRRSTQLRGDTDDHTKHERLDGWTNVRPDGQAQLPPRPPVKF